MELTILSLSPFSCSIEITNSILEPYYSENNYRIFLNNCLIKEKQRNNVFSLFTLNPDTKYNLKIEYDNHISKELIFKTEKVNQIYRIHYRGKHDYTQTIQSAINGLSKNDALIIETGEYDIKPLFLKDDICIYLEQGCHLIASIKRDDYPVLSEYVNNLPLGTWEGNVSKMYASVFTGIHNKNIKIIGEGIIDGNAQNSDWWIDHKNIKIAARPRNIFLNYCENVLLEGLTIINSAAWNIHPYYSKKIKLVNLKVLNPMISPNTDGCDPESSVDVDIIGCWFSVGDDCIAIKSGKKEMIEKYYQPSSNITIRNCLMENGHGAIVLGSESSAGVSNLHVNNCLFINTDRGLRIKTRRGRGSKAVIDNIEFSDILMNKVKNPFVINMFYFCDKDGKSDYVQNKLPRLVDDDTPFLGSFLFKNIECNNILVSAGFFYGLPEQKIQEICFENVSIHMIKNDVHMLPAMMNDIEEVNQIGCYFNNVKNIKLDNFSVTNQIGKDVILFNVDKLEIKENK